MTDLAKCKLCGSEPTLHPRNKWELYHPATMDCSLGNPHIRLPISVKHWQTLMGERAEERPKPKTLSNAKAPKPGQGIPQSVAGQRLDPEFLAETAGRVEEVESEYRGFLEFMDHKHDAIRREITEQNLPSTDLLGQQCFFDWLRQCAREFEAKRIVQPTGSDSDE